MRRTILVSFNFFILTHHTPDSSNVVHPTHPDTRGGPQTSGLGRFRPSVRMGNPFRRICWLGTARGFVEPSRRPHRSWLVVGAASGDFLERVHEVSRDRAWCTL